MSELYRVLKVDGVLVVTTHGQIFTQKLSCREEAEFAAGNLVVRGHVTEGHRTYSAFQPPHYFAVLGQSVGFEICDHIAGKKAAWGLQQDTWIFRKNGPASKKN